MRRRPNTCLYNVRAEAPRMRKRCGRCGVGVEGVEGKAGCYMFDKSVSRRSPRSDVKKTEKVPVDIHTCTYIVHFITPTPPLPCTTEVDPLDDPLFKEGTCRLPVPSVLRGFECATLLSPTDCTSPSLNCSVYAVD